MMKGTGDVSRQMDDQIVELTEAEARDSPNFPQIPFDALEPESEFTLFCLWLTLSIISPCTSALETPGRSSRLFSLAARFADGKTGSQWGQTEASATWSEVMTEGSLWIDKQLLNIIFLGWSYNDHWPLITKARQCSHFHQCLTILCTWHLPLYYEKSFYQICISFWGVLFEQQMSMFCHIGKEMKAR